MSRFRCLVALPAIGVVVAGFAGPSRSERPDSNKNAHQASMKGNWTVVYWKGWTGLVDVDGKDQRFAPAVWTITDDRFGKLPKENPRTAVWPEEFQAYRFAPEAGPGAIDVFGVDRKGRIIENRKTEAIVFVRDDFLLYCYASGGRPNEFANFTTEGTLMILRRGKLTPTAVSQTFPKRAQPKEKDTIEGVWTKIYYEAQDVFLSLVNMEDLTTARRNEPRQVPFAEYVPLQWKVSKNEIEDGGETDYSPVHRFAYRLDPDEGAIDITPLDRDGKAIEHLKKRGIYFVKDDFLFVRYALDGGPRPPRVFTSELGSKTAILILRRGPLTLPP